MKNIIKFSSILFSIVFAPVVLLIANPIHTYAQNNVSDCISINKNLQIGNYDNKDKPVTQLQKFLYLNGYLKTNPTGYFGPLTRSAVKSFQLKEGLPSTGYVGEMTRLKIKNSSCAKILHKEIIENEKQEKLTATTTPIKISEKISLPYSSSNFQDWIIGWGEISTSTPETLALKASKSTNGAQVILEQNSDWTDYRLTANMLIKQAVVTLMTRYIDENNFIGCTFSGKYIEIIQRVDGKQTVLANTSVEYAPYIIFFNNETNLSMKVKGDSVGCTLVGNTDNVEAHNIDSKLSKGGVGIQIYVDALGVAHTNIKSVKVEKI